MSNATAAVMRRALEAAREQLDWSGEMSNAKELAARLRDSIEHGGLSDADRRQAAKIVDRYDSLVRATEELEAAESAKMAVFRLGNPNQRLGAMVLVKDAWTALHSILEEIRMERDAVSTLDKPPQST